MGLYRDESGSVFEVDDTFAASQGFEPVTPEEEHQILASEGAKADAEASGATGGVRSALTGAASSLTLGASDFFLGHGLSDEERRALQEEIGAHPMARAGGEIAGALAGGMGASGTPAGYLGSLANREVEHGLIQGGVRGTAKALTAMGTEGALQSAGQYIGQTALADKETTAEGLAGALGTGFAFSAAGGGAALGISKGTVAARRMFSRAMDGEKAAAAAETSWTATHQELLDADTQTADIARKRLDDMRAAKQEALKYSQEAKNTVREEQIRREAAGPEPKFTPDPVEPMRTEGGTQIIPRDRNPLAAEAGPAGETQVSQTSSARPSDEIGGVGTQVIPGRKTGAGEELKPDFTVEDAGIKPRQPLPKYAEKDPGLAVQMAEDIQAGKAAADEPTGIAGMLDELDQYNQSGKPISSSTSIEDLQLKPTSKAPFGNLRSQLGKKLMPRELPSTAAEVVEDTVSTVRARDIEEHGWQSLSKPGVDQVKTAKGRAAIAEGQRDPITIAVSPNGKYDIVDGTHRLAAAIEANKPIKVKWVKGAAGLDADLSPSLAKMHERINAGETLADLRKSKTAELLGPEIANDESKLTEALEEFEAARKDFLNIATENFSFTMPGKRNVPSDFLEKERGIAVSGEDIGKLREQGKAKAAADSTGAGRRKAADVLDRMHEETLARASGGTAADRGKALVQADDLEKMLENLNARPEVETSGVPHDFLTEVERGAKIIERYEKASAKLAEAVGDAAHPGSVAHAKALSDMEREAERKVMDRTTRSIEDAEQYGPWEQVGPKKLSGKERVTYAKERQLEADKALQGATANERDAKQAYDAAQKKVSAGEKAKKDVLRADAKTARVAAAAQAKRDKVAGLGGLIEMLDIPGLPKPSDLPFIGPLVGAYLKYRALKMAMGRFGGRVAATADARVAVLAARTKDRIARAVDRSLGMLSRGSMNAAKALPAATGVLTRRVYDDGKPDVKAGAHITEVAARRMEEITSYVMTPGAIELDVRRELRDVTDPDIIAAAEAQRRKQFEYLLQNMPKVPDFGPLNKTQWRPSPAQAMSFARRYEATMDPASVYERLEETQSLLSLEAADALRNVYPQLFDMSRQRLFEQAAQLKASLPARKRIQLSLLYKVPLDASMDPVNLQISQSVYERKPDLPPASMGAMPGAPMPAQPPVPSVAQPTNLMPMYQTGADRNSQR